MSTETADVALRKALWTIQKLANELNLDYDQVNNLYHNVMNDISCELDISKSKSATKYYAYLNPYSELISKQNEEQLFDDNYPAEHYITGSFSIQDVLEYLDKYDVRRLYLRHLEGVPEYFLNTYSHIIRIM